MDLLEHMPRALLANGPRGLPWLHWLMLPVVAALAGLLGVVLGRLTMWTLRAISRRTVTNWDDRIIEGTAGPLSCLWAILLGFLAAGELGLPPPVLSAINKVLRVGALVTFFWMLLRLVRIVGKNAETASFTSSRPSMRALVPLAVRIGYFAVVAIALIAVLADLGYPVASLVAGLGIGGLALALAAQKTVENLFGAFSIGVDQPFNVGDFISVDGTQGEVQAIGLRSTRLRTPDRTLVSIPNGKLADMKVETFAARDRIRLYGVLGLTYSTTSSQMRQVMDGLEKVLRAQEKVYQDDVVVKFRSFGADALEIEVIAFFLTTDYAEFRRIRQDVLLSFMEIVEKAGAEFAFPTRTVHLAGPAVPPRKEAQ